MTDTKPPSPASNDVLLFERQTDSVAAEQTAEHVHEAVPASATETTSQAPAAPNPVKQCTDAGSKVELNHGVHTNEQQPRTGIYQPAPNNSALQQGDILTGVIQWLVIELDSDGVPTVDKQPHPYVVVLSQSCDLEWDKQERNKGNTSSDKCLPSILLAPAFPAATIRTRKGDGQINSEKWARIRHNNEERFHFFELIPPGEDADGVGLPELVVDFKKYFSVSVPDLYSQLESSARHRVRLISPYLEHIATRFFYFQARVATPRPHFSTP